MTLPKLTGCVFVKDSVQNPFCLWESVHQLIPLCSEYIIMDLGSTDGTLEVLKGLASKNKKIRLEYGSFDLTRREKTFADLSNELVGMASNDLVIQHQADEIFHEDLVSLFAKELSWLADGIPDSFRGLSFWRIQLENNFQRVKWFPHLINHFDLKERLRYIGDGMSTGRTADAKICGNQPAQDWQKAYTGREEELPTRQMILDVSMTGGFLDQIPERRRKHAPIWGENPEVIYLHGQAVNLQDWYDKEKRSPEWKALEPVVNIPEIMRFHVGKMRYAMRPEVLERIANA